MKKRILLLLSICSVSAFLVTGCNSSNKDETNTETQITTVAESKETDEPNSEDTETSSSDTLEETAETETQTIPETVPDTQAEVIDSTETPPSQNAAGGSITLEDAKSLALQKAGGQGDIVTAVDSYYEGIPVYKIIILSGNMKYISHIGKDDSQFYGYKEINIHARGGQNNDRSATSNQKQDIVITEEEAKEIALSQTAGGDITKLELDYDNTTPIYEIEIVNGNKEYEMEIDATTGVILDLDIDD